MDGRVPAGSLCGPAGVRCQATEYPEWAPPGASNADLDLLGTPVAGRLLFAGEHTQSARLGYADGAMTSGIREAKRLLGTTAVTLGRVTDQR